jgi:hypothetical protein
MVFGAPAPSSLLPSLPMKPPQKSSKLPKAEKLPKALRDQEGSCWLLGRAGLLLRAFFPAFESDSKATFSRAKVSGFHITGNAAVFGRL